MSNRFVRLLQNRDYLLADGAVGTNLFAMGLKTGEAPEFWNANHPEKVAELHRSFIQAGSDIVLTNSFGGNRRRLGLNQAQHRVDELNEAAARIARLEADKSGPEVVVAGSMGPTGEMFSPLGELSFEPCRAIFAEQAQALARGGVDMLWIETMSSTEEVEAAVAGAATTGLPVVCTLSFDSNGRTMMGVTPADLAELGRQLTPPLVAIGANCGVGTAEAVACMLNLARAADVDAVLVAKANCSIPEFVDGAIRYGRGSPEFMADYARLARDAGARIIGGCCGTRPAHIQAMKAALDNHESKANLDMTTVVARLGEVSSGAQAQWRGEMDPLSGAKSGVNAERRTGRRRNA